MIRKHVDVSPDHFYDTSTKKTANSFLGSIADYKIPSSIIVYGPPGCGKSRNSLAIASALNLRTIIDSWDGWESIPETNALILTNIEHIDPRCKLDAISFMEAMRIVKPR